VAAQAGRSRKLALQAVFDLFAPQSAAALAELQDPAAVKPLFEATQRAEYGVRNQVRLRP
jgi:HEAT repeat protein